MIIKKQIFFLLTLSSVISLVAINVSLENTTPFLMHANWEYAGDYFRRDLDPGTTVTVTSGLLFNGWKSEQTYLINPHVGDIWGTNPETGAPLTFTQKMFNGTNIYGIKDDLYWSSAQGIYDKFRLDIIPKKNPADNNNWWPSFEITQIPGTVFDPLVKPIETVVEGATDVINGTKIIIGQISELSKNIKSAMNGITNTASSFEQQVKQLAANPNPLAILDAMFAMSDSLVAATQNLFPILDPIEKMITTIGDHLVKPFDSAKSAEIVAVAQKITGVHTDINEMISKIRLVIPKIKTQALLIHDNVQKSIEAIEKF